MLNKSNPIDVQLKNIPNSIEIRNEYGGVNVSIPLGFGGEVNLNATYGEVITILAVERTKSFRGGGAYAIGKVGNGTGKIEIETTSANVRLMQR